MLEGTHSWSRTGLGLSGDGVYVVSRFLGRGCDEAIFSEKRFFSEKGGGIQ